MTVVSTIKDPESLSLTVVAEFDWVPERVWRVREDVRKLEQWWGPRSWPASFTRHDFVVGDESPYHLTGPREEVHRGFGRMCAIDWPKRLDFAHGLAGSDGEPTPEVPLVAGYVTFDATDRETRMTVMTRFIDLTQMEMMLGMGVAEGMTQAVGQIDALLASASV